MSLNVRLGTTSDRRDIIEFLIVAGNGIFEQMFEGSLPRLRLRDALRLGVCEERSPYFIENAVLVTEEEKNIGCMIGFSGDDYGLPDIVKTVISKKRLAPLERLFASKVANSFYINTLAVHEHAGGRGIAGLLLDVADEMALEIGAKFLSLHVWAANEAAFNLYTKRGFEPVEEIIIPQTEYLHHADPMVLMRAPVTEKCLDQ